MGIATEGWFRGLWRMARVITGPEGRLHAAFAGTCRFEPDGEGLVCREAGVLRRDCARYPSGRVTLWRFPGAGRVEVLFADGRPFHAFTAERPEGVHLCGADRYEVAYSFGEDAWFSRWAVRGPAKSYVMKTRHRRIPHVPMERNNPSRAF